jgi:hypothetical protein
MSRFRCELSVGTYEKASYHSRVAFLTREVDRESWDYDNQPLITFYYPIAKSLVRM